MRITPERRRIIALMADDEIRPAAAIAEAAACSPAVVRSFAEAGGLEGVLQAPSARFAGPDWQRPPPIFSPEQAAAAADLKARLAAGGYSAVLLDGVTGSGKTEVYLEAVAACLAAGHQALVLLPEIALSAQGLARFEARFGVPPAVWHSELTPKARRETWRAVASGEARVVVGARSALFFAFCRPQFDCGG